MDTNPPLSLVLTRPGRPLNLPYYVTGRRAHGTILNLPWLRPWGILQMSRAIISSIASPMVAYHPLRKPWTLSFGEGPSKDLPLLRPCSMQPLPLVLYMSNDWNVRTTRKPLLEPKWQQTRAPLFPSLRHRNSDAPSKHHRSVRDSGNA